MTNTERGVRQFLKSWCKKNNYIFGSKVKKDVIRLLSEVLEAQDKREVF